MGNPWFDFVDEYQLKHPNLTRKEACRAASKPYQASKAKSGKGIGSDIVGAVAYAKKNKVVSKSAPVIGQVVGKLPGKGRDVGAVVVESGKVAEQLGFGAIDDVMKPIKFLNEYGKEMFDYADKHNVNKKGKLPTFKEFGINLGQNALHAPEAIIKGAERSGLIKKSGKGKKQGAGFVEDVIQVIPKAIDNQIEIFKKQRNEGLKRRSEYEKNKTPYGDRVLNELRHTGPMDSRPQVQLAKDLSKPVSNLVMKKGKGAEGGSVLPMKKPLRLKGKLVLQ